MKLKTLKDLKVGCKNCLGGWVNYNKLKQEAIKWAKSKGVMREIEWSDWVEFFNISEEDLKGGLENDTKNN